MCINYSVKRFVAIIILYMIRKSNFEFGPQGGIRTHTPFKGKRF